MQLQRQDIHPGMTVRDSRQHRLGHVTRCWDDYFEVKKGIAFEHVWMVPYSDVGQTRGKSVNLVRSVDEESEVLAGYVMKGDMRPSMASSANRLQHWMSVHFQ